MEGVTFKIDSLFTALKSDKKMDIPLRSSHTPSVIMFYQCPTPGSFHFTLLVKWVHHFDVREYDEGTSDA